MKILIVEDDVDLLDMVAYALRRERFAVVEATDGAQALHRWKIDRPDLIVLDLNLPRQDGFEVLRQVRESGTTPVVVLTGRQDEQSILRCFSLGADDYVTKPFSAKVLAMRIRVILRRLGGSKFEETPPVLEVGGLRLDPEAYEVRWGERSSRLTPTEFRILHLLAMNAGRIVTTNRLLAYVWGADGGDVNVLRTHISHIRQKLQIGRHGTNALSDVPRVGYVLSLNPPAPSTALPPAQARPFPSMSDG